MRSEKKVIARRLVELSNEEGSCGARKRLITEKDCRSVAFSHLKISDAKKHFHKETTEFYYVLKGAGWLETDAGSFSLAEGTMIMIQPGVIHRAISDHELEVLIAMTPPHGESGDQYFVSD